MSASRASWWFDVSVWRNLRPALSLEQVVRGLLLATIVGFLLVFLVVPIGLVLLQSVFDFSDGTWRGLDNFRRYFAEPALRASLVNTLAISAATACCSTTLAMAFAYGLTRCRLPGHWLFHQVALLPLYAPTMLFGIGLIYLLGEKGLLSNADFGLVPALSGLEIYGPIGITFAMTLFTLPAALLVLLAALSHGDQRLYDAAAALGASRWRQFLTITLPSCRFGLVSAFFITFVLAFTDFGVPKMLPAKEFNVLAIEVYQQVVNRNDNAMGATVSVLLLMPTLLAFAIDQFVQRRQTSSVSSGGKAVAVEMFPLRDAALWMICAAVSLVILAVMFVPAFVALVDVWPYSLFDRAGLAAATGQAVADVPVWSWRHWSQALSTRTGNPYFTSLVMSAGTAAIGTALVFVAAYILEKQPLLGPLRQVIYYLMTAPLALPGLVIGLAYVLFFVQHEIAGWPNPLHGLYRTMGLLIACNVVHFLGVSFLTATVALKQLDRDFEPVGASLGVPFYTTFFRITLPICLPAVLEVAMYFFVSSMATVSALVFLKSSDYVPAAVAVIDLENEGATQKAAALATMILLTNIAVRLLVSAACRPLRRRAERWLGQDEKTG